MTKTVKTPNLAAHTAAIIEDDGAPEIARCYRYHCKCGELGAWRPSVQAAKNDHSIHKHTADL